MGYTSGFVAGCWQMVDLWSGPCSLPGTSTMDHMGQAEDMSRGKRLTLCKASSIPQRLWSAAARWIWTIDLRSWGGVLGDAIGMAAMCRANL
jgi:hypothetical protein